jgi:transposase
MLKPLSNLSTQGEAFISLSIGETNKHKRFSLLRIWDENAEPDNNSSERAIRNIKVKQKISNQFKTPKGVQVFAVLRSITDTAIKTNLNIFDTLFYVSNLRAE